jgi:hypothetical protein
MAILQLKTKKELAEDAHKLAGSLNLVRYRNVTYIPADYETREIAVPPAPGREIWLPINRDRVRLLARDMFDTLFATDGELSSFDFMVAQNAEYIEDPVQTLLVRTPTGLQELGPDGTLAEPSGSFVPNTLRPMLNTEADTKEKTFAVIAEWLDSEEEAHALLRHLATSLAPGWSAVKYVLLLGEGRNGKSLLLRMLQAVMGKENASSVTRQQISEMSPVVTDLNGKLLNLVFDGQATYLKDSGAEKTLIAGEPFPIRRLYESTPTTVQTSALFVEGLQHEPKSKDKSPALQKRLVRFHFPNVYPMDRAFEKLMLSEERLGAFLSLLIDHFVKEEDLEGDGASAGAHVRQLHGAAVHALVRGDGHARGQQPDGLPDLRAGAEVPVVAVEGERPGDVGGAGRTGAVRSSD